MEIIMLLLIAGWTGFIFATGTFIDRFSRKENKKAPDAERRGKQHINAK